MSGNPFEPLKATADAAKSNASKASWEVVLPVPAGVPPPPARYGKYGRPTATWTYRDANGQLLGFILRCDADSSEKAFLPLTYCRHTETGKREWRWRSWDVPRPIYGLDRLASRPDASVILVEGEKAADAAGKLLPDYVAIASPGGSNAAGKADWSPLAGRDVVTWPDSDVPGARYAIQAGRLLQAAGAASLACISPPEDKPSGWDAADALSEGWTVGEATALIDAACPGSRASCDGSTDDVEREEAGSRSRKRTPHRDVVLTLLGECVFWHDPEREAYASLPVKGHIEHARIRSRDFRMYVAGRYFWETGGAIAGQALQDALNVLESRAIHDGERHETWRRVGWHEKDLYIDLADDAWRAVRIRPDGWNVCNRPPVKFLRSGASRPLCEPEAGESIDMLRRYVNVASDDDFLLIVGWLLGALCCRKGPCPILAVSGEQGSGKSGLTELLADLVDPETGKKRTAPREERDLIVAAVNGHVLLYDNLSGIAPWFADALCRVSTGGGFAARQLHTDADQIVISAQRPIVFNGIPDLTRRADLADRSIAVHLPNFATGTRLTESEFRAQFEADKPAILGALFDGLCAALRNWDKTILEDPPRMADFARWVEACSSGLGWERGAFLQAYERNRKDAAAIAFEADLVAVAVKAFMDKHHPDGWQGTPTDLYDTLCNHTPDQVRNQRTWPKSPAALGQAMRRIAPLLRQRGYDFHAMKSGNRFMTIKPTD